MVDTYCVSFLLIFLIYRFHKSVDYYTIYYRTASAGIFEQITTQSSEKKSMLNVSNIVIFSMHFDGKIKKEYGTIDIVVTTETTSAPCLVRLLQWEQGVHFFFEFSLLMK